MTFAAHTPCSLAATSVLTGLSPTVTVILSLAPKPEPLTFKLVPGGPLERSSLKLAPSVSVTARTLVEEVRGPEARIVWEPAAAVGTVKVLDHFPWASAAIPEASVVPSKVTVMPVSLAPKPTPVAVTEMPGEALGRSIESNGVTVKVVWTLPADGADALMTRGPAGTSGAWKEIDIEPWPSAEAGRSGAPSKVTATVALGPKPEPATFTVAPGGPLSGETDKEDVMVKVRGKAGAFPTLSVYEPATTGGMLNDVEKEPEVSATPEATCLPSKTTGIPAWEAPKPSPLTFTRVPGGPLLMDREAVGFTVKVAVIPSA
ncbi:MAG: hypothetical protein AAB291_03860 [Chloroflexota bacterium]